MTTAAFKTGYLDKAIDNVDEVIATAQVELEGVDFDTIVGTGFSGALIVPMLAAAMGKHFVLVRKPKDGSHHSGPMIGNLGERWIFVDDFVSSGETRDRVLGTIEDACDSYGETLVWDPENCEYRNEVKGFDTTYVGDYLYAIDPTGTYETRKRWQPLCPKCGRDISTQQGLTTCWDCSNDEPDEPVTVVDGGVTLDEPAMVVDGVTLEPGGIIDMQEAINTLVANVNINSQEG